VIFRRKRDPQPSAHDTAIVRGDFTGQIWTHQPLRIPPVPDVDAFLSQDPLPLLWPDDPTFIEYLKGDQGDLRRYWLYCLLHHPAAEVVVQCLHSRFLTGNIMEADRIAELIITGGSPVREEAAATAWTLPEFSLSTVFTIVLSLGVVPADFTAGERKKAVKLLSSTCLCERRAFLAEQLAR
jgi:hypothetical protein